MTNEKATVRRYKNKLLQESCSVLTHSLGYSSHLRQKTQVIAPLSLQYQQFVKINVNLTLTNKKQHSDFYA